MDFSRSFIGRNEVRNKALPNGTFSRDDRICLQDDFFDAFDGSC
jgi:hypothetical protein